jgi:hypothetical protein
MGGYGLTEQYETNLSKGTEYQDFVMEKLHEIGITIMSYSSKKYQVLYGENRAGVEIKFDDRMKETGNIYFELSEKSKAGNKEYITSGIFRNDNTWLYAIGNYEIIYLCGKKHLRQIYEREKGNRKFARFVETPTSRGMLLPQKYVEEKVAVKMIKIVGA